MSQERRPPGWLNRLVAFFFRGLVVSVMLLYFRWRVHNRPRIDGGHVLVANHTSFLDPLVLGAASSRRVVFLMSTVSYRSPLLGWIFRLFRSIPVDPRGGNRAAVRQSRAALEAGEVLGVFPEGGISRDGGLLLGNPGAVALVLEKNVSIVPVGLVGVGDALPHGAAWPRPRRIEVRFGEPISADELIIGEHRKGRLAVATARIMREIAALTGQISREEELLRQKT